MLPSGFFALNLFLPCFARPSKKTGFLHAKRHASCRCVFDLSSHACMNMFLTAFQRRGRPTRAFITHRRMTSLHDHTSWALTTRDEDPNSMRCQQYKTEWRSRKSSNPESMEGGLLRYRCVSHPSTHVHSTQSSSASHAQFTCVNMHICMYTHVFVSVRVYLHGNMSLISSVCMYHLPRKAPLRSLS